jgi:L,D-peptidoglycan transpeptidase YkuD (ErfK/YbiS/YcfS/YnhG family)
MPARRKSGYVTSTDTWPISSRLTANRLLRLFARDFRSVFPDFSGMRTIRLALLAFIFECLSVSETAQALESDSRLQLSIGLRRSIPEMRSCRQLIIVTTSGWADVNARVQLLGRRQDGFTWQNTGAPFPGVVGKCGFAWGIGVHGAAGPGIPAKKEGDQKSPAGVFKLYAVFGTASPQQVHYLRFPYEQVDAATEAVDDPHSKYYNRVVKRGEIKHPDWATSESMLQVPTQYRFGVMIEHNWSQIPGSGSCIFLHVWNSSETGTVGCTAISLTNLLRLLHWLNAQENPLIIQLPLPEYARVKKLWNLP